MNRLTEVLALATVALLGLPDTAGAQTLTFSPNPVVFTIAGPGQSATAQTVTVTLSSGTVNNISIGSISTSNGTNWLTVPSVTGNTFTVALADSVTAALAPNTTYTGSISVSANSFSV